MTNSRKKKKGTALFILALICLISPSIHVMDPLPDFIAYIIIWRMLGYAAKRAPYFEEACAAFKKLALLSAAKIPAFLVIVQARSQVSNDNDIYALFAFTFAVIEAVLVYSAITNLFLGIFYLGERCDAALIKPYRISKGRKRYATVEGLRFLTLAFAFFKCAAYSLPELLLLTRGVDSSAYYSTFNFAGLYPYTVVTMLAVTVGLGIFWAVRCMQYRRSVISEGRFEEAVDSLFDERGRVALEKKLWLGRMRGELTLATVASFFTFDLVFSDFRDINLLPHTVFAILITVAAAKLSKYVGKYRVALLVTGSTYACVSLVSYISSVSFLTKYTYENLVTSSSAREAYQPTVVLGWIEFLSLLVFLSVLAVMLIRFTLMHTGLDRGSDRYMRPDAEYHATMKRRTVIWTGLGALTGLTKGIQTMLKSTVKLIYVGIGDSAGGGTIEPVAEQMLPWFGIVTVATTVAFVAASLHYFGVLKSETEIKYGSD